MEPIKGDYHYHCFVDMAVSEYIVGSGPIILTVSMYNANLWDGGDADLKAWDDQKKAVAYYLDDPRGRISDVYDGRELILFLDLPFTIAVESWNGKGEFTVWSVHRNESNEINAVAEDIYYAQTDEQRARLNLPLEELTRQVKEATATRMRITEGRIGKETDLPMLVTDANYLQDFYISVGAVYDGSEGATALPPPVPEEDDNDEATFEPFVEDEMVRAEVSYLEEVIPPCVPATGSQRGPCEVVYPPPIVELANTHSDPGWPLHDDMPPSFTGMLLGDEAFPDWTPHIVVRATVLPKTTRCGVYIENLFDYDQDKYSPFFRNSYVYHCFSDFRINEYVVGTGPPKITVLLYNEDLVLSYEQRENLENIKEDLALNYLRDPRSRIADAYEGREIVMFLKPSSNISVESWQQGYQFSTWFVHDVGGGAIRAVEPNIRYARTDEQHNKLDLPLDELIEGLRQAGEERYAITGGRIGVDSDLPMLVTDANFLKDFYLAAGPIFYESGGKTVLPPPVPR